LCVEGMRGRVLRSRSVWCWCQYKRVVRPARHVGGNEFGPSQCPFSLYVRLWCDICQGLAWRLREGGLAGIGGAVVLGGEAWAIRPCFHGSRTGTSRRLSLPPSQSLPGGPFRVPLAMDSYVAVVSLVLCRRAGAAHSWSGIYGYIQGAPSVGAPVPTGTEEKYAPWGFPFGNGARRPHWGEACS